MLRQSLSLQFLGTGSQKSTMVRASNLCYFINYIAQAMALLIRNGYQIGEWLFDCGDCTK